MPSPEQQDRLFTEAARMLRPGTFVGSDSRLSLRFRLLHVSDTMVAADPAALPNRLQEAGLVAEAAGWCVGWLVAHAAGKVECVRLFQDLDQIATKTAIPTMSLHRYLTDVDR